MRAPSTNIRGCDQRFNVASKHFPLHPLGLLEGLREKETHGPCCRFLLYARYLFR